MLEKFFNPPQSAAQVNFLKCLAALPDARRLHGDTVEDEIIVIAEDAKEWISNTKKQTVLI